MLIDNIDALLQATSEVMNVTKEGILGSRKTFAESFARQIVMALWAESHSLQATCDIVGRTHHTAAFYARRKIHERLLYCHSTQERIKKVIQKYSEIILANNQECDKTISGEDNLATITTQTTLK